MEEAERGRGRRRRSGAEESGAGPRKVAALGGGGGGRRRRMRRTATGAAAGSWEIGRRWAETSLPRFGEVKNGSGGVGPSNLYFYRPAGGFQVRPAIFFTVLGVLIFLFFWFQPVKKRLNLQFCRFKGSTRDALRSTGNVTNAMHQRIESVPWVCLERRPCTWAKLHFDPL